jgi:sRNA-binding regulator protein Hfq
MKGVFELLEQLKSNIGKTVVIELVNGRKISGTVQSADQQYVRLESDEGNGTIPVQAVYIVWETPSRTLTSENMDEIAEKLRDSVKAEIACTGVRFDCTTRYICSPPHNCSGAFSCPFSFMPSSLGGSQCPVQFACTGTQFYGIVGPPDMGTPPQFGGPVAGQYGQDDAKAEIACTSFPGFSCARSYICRPPDTCTFSFACPGSYAPSFPSGGGACPIFFCRPFQFGQPCGPFQFGQPCGPFQFSQPCGPFQFGQPCGPFQFSQPCGPFQFQCRPFQIGQPCGPFQFGQPCSPFVFGGSQCGVPGGFTCPGQQFIGIAPAGAPAGVPTGPLAHKPPLSPMEFSVKDDKQSEDKKETKE